MEEKEQTINTETVVEEGKSTSNTAKNVVIGILLVAIVALLVVIGMVWSKGDGSQNNQMVMNQNSVESTMAPQGTLGETSAPDTEEDGVAATKEPEANQEIVEATEAPEMTEEPDVAEATEAPEVTEEPDVVEATEAPQSTEAPKATEGPKPTEKPRTDGSLSPLHLDGTQLCDENNNPIQLRGVSTHGIGWFPQYVNEDFFKELKEEWNANVVRLAMYTHENNGYCSGGNKDELKQLVKDGVKYATNQGLYVIIDWHVLQEQNPHTYKSEAKVFFEEMSKEYKDYTNVIYEICNEPNGGVSWSDVKSYAKEVIEVIRKEDEDAIIIVGTPNWCQYVDQAAGDPITEYDNIMYALHFYAATHKDDLRTKMKNAVNNGLPIFVSEYGICDASGNGGIDYNQSDAWVKAMDDLGVSYVAWNVSNKSETSAMISSGCNKASGFGKDDLSACGKWVYELLSGKSADSFKPSNNGNNQSGNTQNNNQGNNNQQNNQSSQPTQAPSANISTGEGLTISAEAKDSWGGGDAMNYNYNLTITNNSGRDVDGWKITVEFTSELSGIQGWGGNFTIDGKKLYISNVDYNGKIAKDGSVKDVGFIVTGKEGMTIVN